MSQVTRHVHGRGFTYRYDDGSTVKDAALKRFIKDLAIPPAWKKVKINTDRASKVYATGRDEAGRKQYIYNPDFVEKQSAKKYERLLRFGKQLETMRRITGQHLRDKGTTKRKALACMVRLIDAAYFRPGSKRYAKENETYGLTTMRSRHLNIKGSKLIFEYVGKSSKEHKRVVEDEKLSKIVAELDDLPGYEIFQYVEEGEKKDIRSQDLNEYIKEIMGEDFSAKDFRTWAGTVIAAVALDELGVSPDKKESKSNIIKAVRTVAKKLGNTDAIARENYIDPRVIESYVNGKTISYFKDQIDQIENFNSFEEKAVLLLLRSAIE